MIRMMYLPLLLALGAVLLIGMYAVRKVDKFIEENRSEIEKEMADAPEVSEESITDSANVRGTDGLRSYAGRDVNSSHTALKKSIGCNSRIQIL